MKLGLILGVGVAVIAAIAAHLFFDAAPDVAAMVGGGGGGLTGLTLAAVVQSSYAERMSEGIEGMIATMHPHAVDSRNVENTNGIGFGKAVGKGVNDRGCVLGAVAVSQFLGISVRDVTLAPVSSDSDYVDEYPYRSLAGILTRGDIWCRAGGNVVDGDEVTFNSTTGVLSSAAASGTQFIIAGARWQTTAASGALGIVRLSGHLPVA